MKLQSNAILLLIIMTGYLLRPLFPYVEYALNKSYIEKNLCINRDKPKSCCQGKCYLRKEIAKQADDTPADKKSDTHKVKQGNDVKEFLSFQSKIQFFTSITNTYERKLINNYNYLLISSIFVPPQHIV